MDEPSGWFLTRLFHSEFKTIIIPKEGSVLIGRDNAQSCIPIKTPRFQHVSRTHCTIRFGDGRPTIMDQSSAGGTYIGDKRLSAARPGEIVLQEGDMIGIGTHVNDTDHFYKANDHVLFYRVCKIPSFGEVIVLSDDDDEVNDEACQVDTGAYSSDNINDDEEIRIPTSTTNAFVDPLYPAVVLPKEKNIAKVPQAATLCAKGQSKACEVIPETAMLIIPENSLIKQEQCSWEEEYDRMLSVARNVDLDESIISVSDDEFTEHHYSQALWQEIKQESVDVYEEYEPAQPVAEKLFEGDSFRTAEENNFNRWKEKLDKSEPSIVAGKIPRKAGRKKIKIIDLSDPEPVVLGSKTLPAKHRNENVDSEVEPKTLPAKRRNENVDSEPELSRPPENSAQNTGPRKPVGIPERRLSLIDMFENARTPSTKLISDPPKPTKGIPKRRASVSIADYDTIIKKKLKRRFSVSDRCPVRAAATPLALDATKKEDRSKRLKELAAHGKQLIAPTVEPVKTGLTKPPVKYTKNNRGAFLTVPVVLNPKPRSRPVVEDEMQVCTQSTTLEELRQEPEETDAIIDIRPTKMTFKSVERLSNVDRPVPPPTKSTASTRNSARVMGLPSNSKQPACDIKPANSKKSTVLGIPAKSVPSSSPPVPQQSKAPKPPEVLTQINYPVRRTGPNCRVSFDTGKIKGILKSPVGNSKGKIRKRVAFAESDKTVVVSRYLPYFRSVAAPSNLAEILRQQELTVLSVILRWKADWLEGSGEVPVGEQLLQILENYPSLETFRDTMQPFLMRELWQDIRSQYKSIRQPLPLTELMDVHLQEIPYELCQITCRACIRTKKKQQPWGNEIGVLYYKSRKRNRACRLFAYVSNRFRENSANRTSAPPEAGVCYKVLLYVALSELEDMRSGSGFSFCPITTISLHLRSVKALHLLEYSPLLPNVLKPAQNNRVQVAPEKTFADEPQQRDAIIARIGTDMLNEVQMGVVLSVLEECSRWNEPSISLIQGPPGTGKSHVISHLALELMHIEPPTTRIKVLICAQSNTAVDVIAKRLLGLQKARDPENSFILLRVGSREKVDEQCLKIFIDDWAKGIVVAEDRHNAREMEANMRDTYRSELLILDKRIRQLEQEVGNNADVNRSRLDECYQRRARLNELLSQTAGSVTSNMSADERYTKECNARSRLVEQADIVCTTLGSCYLLETYGKKPSYDVCIIDEATQCTEIYSLLPLLYGMRKMVLVGDINQLPATILDLESIKAGFRQSLFSRLHDACGEDKVKMLMMQYRMHPEICHWPNKYFYKRQLQNHPSTLTPAQETCSLKPYLVVSLSYDQQLTQAQYEIYNRDEIEFVVGLLKRVVPNCPRESSIAIVTPYQRHKLEIVDQLRKSNLTQVQVHSIDSVQGKEYDVVIVSLARSIGTGFLNSPERINVALTRARKCLVLCGNFGCLRQKPVWKSLLEDAERRDLFVHVRGDAIEKEISGVMKRLVQKYSKK